MLNAKVATVGLLFCGFAAACSADDSADRGSAGSAGATSMGGAKSASGGASNTGGSVNGGAGGSDKVGTGGLSNTAGKGGAASTGGGAGTTGGRGPDTKPDPINGLPEKVVAGYYFARGGTPIRIRDVHKNYNVIYLFAAKPVGDSGAVEWQAPPNGKGAASNLNADIQHVRKAEGRKVILSVGGQGGGMTFPSRSKSETFIDNIVKLYDQFGGIDGLDWNTFEAGVVPSTSEMVWISLELKRRYPGFIITSPPAPWRPADLTFCETMVKAGALDYAGPQYYDGPNLDTQSYITTNIEQWVSKLGPTHVVVGFGIWDQDKYMSVAEAVPTWKEVESKHPTLRGAFNWQVMTDEQAGWGFAEQVAPLVLD
jgi:hypothetical protein